MAPVGPEESSDSSRGSTPDVMRRPKPPVPPRVAPPPAPVRTPSADLISIPQGKNEK